MPHALCGIRATPSAVLQVELPSLQAGVAAAQEADVFIGMHGAWPAVQIYSWKGAGSECVWLSHNALQPC